MSVTPDEIIRSNRKTLSIMIDGFGRLIVRAPMRCTQERIFAFLAAKEKWILQKQAERRAVGIVLPSESLEGYSFPLLGEEVTIRLTDGKRILYNAQERTVYLPKQKGQEGIKKWLKENAKRIFKKVTDEYARQMGVEYSSLSVTSARSRWGSCSAKNSLRYTFRLVYCPREIIEYVAVHELAHIRHKDHSKAFWREVERSIPEWKQRRRWLKLRGALLQIF